MTTATAQSEAAAAPTPSVPERPVNPCPSASTLVSRDCGDFVFLRRNLDDVHRWEATSGGFDKDKNYHEFEMELFVRSFPVSCFFTSIPQDMFHYGADVLRDVTFDLSNDMVLSLDGVLSCHVSPHQVMFLKKLLLVGDVQRNLICFCMFFRERVSRRTDVFDLSGGMWMYWCCVYLMYLCRPTSVTGLSASVPSMHPVLAASLMASFADTVDAILCSPVLTYKFSRPVSGGDSVVDELRKGLSYLVSYARYRSRQYCDFADNHGPFLESGPFEDV